jgi:hypothetical protein
LTPDSIRSSVRKGAARSVINSFLESNAFAHNSANLEAFKLKEFGEVKQRTFPQMLLTFQNFESKFRVLGVVEKSKPPEAAAAESSSAITLMRGNWRGQAPTSCVHQRLHQRTSVAIRYHLVEW